ncbi:MAG: S41 family peptidase [Phycisphaeraceae bacterium]|nr:S41 family peptidase [Phycisphaeraceae bacterium]
MTFAKARRMVAASLAAVVASAGAALGAAPAFEPGLTALANETWAQARAGQGDLAISSLNRLLAAASMESGAALRAQKTALEANIASREAKRAERAAEVGKELSELAGQEPTPLTLSNMLKLAVELQMLQASDRKGVLGRADIVKLVADAAAAARRCEAANDVLMASELFQRLNTLLDEEATYKDDARRLLNRLGMIRLYNPQRLWELRNERRKMDKLPPLPAFNAVGEDAGGKLKGVTSAAVLGALSRAADLHVEHVPLRAMLIGGLENIRTLISTPDLKSAFPGLADEKAVAEFDGWLSTRVNDLKAARTEPSRFGVSSLVEELVAAAGRTVKLADTAVLHEFGNGAFGRLDDYSNIIWPDELARFKRMTEGSFIGIGVQIQLDEETQMIKVVTPLEGTPAFRAGIKTGDFIKKINGATAVGMSLDQAVEQITGPAGTKVTLLMERDGNDIEFVLTRSKIPLVTVKGWKRTGNKDSDWDWFIDRTSGIGYVRLTGFNEESTREILAAVDSMKKVGLRGLILDLRFNPGGLLTQAVSISNLFIADGTIVSTESAGGVQQQIETAEPNRARLKGVPLAVLINESSASASEIVSGAIRWYADQGQIDAIVVGERSFGKGSVQNVLQLTANTMLKLTTQYYKLPSGKIIHRRDHDTTWGVEPHIRVSMLPKQISEALTLRQEADVTPEAAEAAKPGKDGIVKPRPDPERLLTEGLDVQLQTALVFLQAKALAAKSGDVKNAQATPATNPG